jgi:hypothetical protein
MLGPSSPLHRRHSLAPQGRRPLTLLRFFKGGRLPTHLPFLAGTLFFASGVPLSAQDEEVVLPPPPLP